MHQAPLMDGVVERRQPTAAYGGGLRDVSILLIIRLVARCVATPPVNATEDLHFSCAVKVGRIS